MPLTPFQSQIALLLASNRSLDSYLAGGAALHFSPQSIRYSNDLDYFHDSVERVASAFNDDKKTLEASGYIVVTEMQQPGFIRARVSADKEVTKIEWSHHSDWRFMPVIYEPQTGYQLHAIDIAVNKVLALAGRDEPRDFLDVLVLHASVLSLGALCWAAAGKDPGFSPSSLLELLKRKGRYRQEDFTRLMLTKKVDLKSLKQEWLSALEQAQEFISQRPPTEVGCLYYDTVIEKFVDPTARTTMAKGATVIVPHYGRPGGVLPEVKQE